MLVFRRIFALVMLALWLPATSHCALNTLAEQVGDACVSLCAHDKSVSSAKSAAHHVADSCALVEEGVVKVDGGAAAVPMPALFTLACLDCLHAAIRAQAEAVEPSAHVAAHPDEWMPARHVETRAVAPARAPGLV